MNKPTYHYYVTNNEIDFGKKSKLQHPKNKPFATERDAFAHIKNKPKQKHGLIHKVHTETGKIVSHRGVWDGQAGYTSQVGKGDPNHLSQLKEEFTENAKSFFKFINELSKKTINSYQKKAHTQANNLMKTSLIDTPKSVQVASAKALERRKKGLKTAFKKVGIPEESIMFEENTMPWTEADKLADKHANIAMKHKRAGNAAGYRVHADVSNYITDRLVNTMHPLPVKSTMISKKSAAAMKAHPLKEDVKNLDEHAPGTKVTYDRTKKERGEAVVVSKSTAKKNHYYVKDTKNGNTVLVPHHELEPVKESTQLDELSTNTLGRYAKKAHNRADIAARMVHKSGDEMDKIANKRTKGTIQAVRKLGKKSGDSNNATRTSNAIKTNISLAKNWKSNNDVNDAANKNYDKAQKGISKLWDKAAKIRESSSQRPKDMDGLEKHLTNLKHEHAFGNVHIFHGMDYDTVLKHAKHLGFKKEDHRYDSWEDVRERHRKGNTHLVKAGPEKHHWAIVKEPTNESKNNVKEATDQWNPPTKEQSKHLDGLQKRMGAAWKKHGTINHPEWKAARKEHDAYIHKHKIYIHNPD